LRKLKLKKTAKNFNSPFPQANQHTRPMSKDQPTQETIAAVIARVSEMQKWRRSEGEYAADTAAEHKLMPYSSAEFGRDIDVLIAVSEEGFTPAPAVPL
jgi:hypothetical protein